MQYNSLNVKLNKLKSAIKKNKTEVVLRLSSNMIGDDETNFPQKLLTNRQVVNLCKAFADKSWNDIKLTKTQIPKMMQSGGLPLMKNVIKPLAKSVLIPLGLTAAASAADAGIHKKILGLGNHPSHNNTTLIISNDEMEGIIKTIKSFDDSGLLLKGVTETVQNEAKEQKGGFLSILLGTLGAILLGNILTGKGAIATKSKSQGRGTNRAGKGL